MTEDIVKSDEDTNLMNDEILKYVLICVHCKLTDAVMT